MASESEIRAAIDRTAQQQVDHAQRNGVTISFQQVRERVAEAVQRGDLKRREQK